MASITDECAELKKEYDDCFNRWFADSFLKGQTDDSVCAGVFRFYQQCVKNAIKAHNIDFKVKDAKIGPESEQRQAPD